MTINRGTILNRLLGRPDLLRKPVENSVNGIFNVPLRDRAFEPNISGGGLTPPVALSDLDPAGANAGDVVTLNGGAWTAQAPGGGSGALFDGVTFTFVQPDPADANPIVVTIVLTLSGIPIAYPMTELLILDILDSTGNDYPLFGTEITTVTGVYALDDNFYYFYIGNVLSAGVWSPDGGSISVTAAALASGAIRLALIYRDQVFISGPMVFVIP